jgi:hypothetical protein
MKRIALGALVAVLLTGGTAHASPASLARALARDPVYVQRGADPTLSVRERGRLRLQIARQDTGRVKVAVVRASEASAAGSARDLANGIDHRLRGKGSLIVVAGAQAYLITSYPQVGPATDALRSGFERNQGKGLFRQLSAGIRGIAERDPGPSADAGATAPPRSVDVPASDDVTKKVADGIRLAVLIVAVAVALPFVLVAGWLLLRFRRGRREQAELLTEERDAFRDEVVTLGDQIRDLDLDVEMPDADPRGKAEYERALEIYDQANEALSARRSGASIQRARAALAEGRERMEHARTLLEAQRQPDPR